MFDWRKNAGLKWAKKTALRAPELAPGKRGAGAGGNLPAGTDDDGCLGYSYGKSRVYREKLCRR